MRIEDTRPIWVQLVEDFRQRVVTGQWPAGSRVPSVRELATGSGVNPNTVQRALSELDRIGLTAPERTAGRFVTTDTKALEAARHELATSATDTFIAAVTRLGMDLPQAEQVLAERWTARKPTRQGEPQ